MAGIGFELKKLYKDKGLLQTLKAHTYSIFVTIGPLIISVLAITFLYRILKYFGVPRVRLELLQGTIMYSFIFSVVLTSGYCMMLSRYLADRLYEKKTEEILSAFYGSISFILMILGIIGVSFYFNKPLEPVYKFFAYFLFVGLATQMVISVFISAIKDFKRVAFAFFYGVIGAFISGYCLFQFTDFQDILSVLIAFDICILIVIIFLAYEIKKYFAEKSPKFFNFMKYFELAYKPLLVNTFYTSSLYVHNFMFWIFSDLYRVIEGTYTYAPYYDIPAGYAFLSIMPTLVMFVVKVETSFYSKYANYFQLINNNACYEDIEVSKKEMFTSITRELTYMMEVQLFCSIAAIILGMKFLPLAGFTSSQIDIYSIVVLAYYCIIMCHVIMTLLLYFDYQKGALIITFTALVTNGVFTYISIQLGEAFYGVGFLASGILTLVLSLIILYKFLRNVDYYVFCVHVAWQSGTSGVLERLVDNMYEQEV